MKFPKYPKRPHRSGHARISLRGRDYYLGPWGSPESYAEYARLQAQTVASPGVLPMKQPDGKSSGPITINALAVRWLADVESKATTITEKELGSVQAAITPLLRLFGPQAAADFTVKKLKLLRQAFVDASWMTPAERADRKRRGMHVGWCRTYANKATQKVRRLFRWAEEDGLVPKGIWAHLGALKALNHASGVREVPERVAADFESQVKPALPFMAPVVKAMVEVQHLIGARPSEVCRMKRSEIDQTSVEGVWLFRPGTHKGSWRGDDLVKVIGPQAQIVLAPWLMAAEPDGYVFPPAKQRYKRGHYTSEGYGRATFRAAKLAGVKHWTPYCLRYAAGQRAETLGGIAGAAAYLGHRSHETTKGYLERQNLGVAVEVAKKIG